MKRLWRPFCIWLLGHDWTYWYDFDHTGRCYVGSQVPSLSPYFSHMTCHRCLDRIG